MAVLHISEADLARDIHAVLDRVQSGAEVIVERNAQPIAILRPAEPRRRKLSEIAASLAEDSTAVIDPAFAKDVQEAVDSHLNRREGDQYSRIREEIVASGLPTLSDDDARAEIRKRRGVGDDTKS
jgi:antitoxin (DNA-binding transcriptional repressor) of toxin-antitoxin stability system